MGRETGTRAEVAGCRILGAVRGGTGVDGL